ncbi:MAG: hypothetical protein KGI50_05300 [Patescibacteria group bacterium]|nr:hypothetical protein [Patescibacteria group bacterium]MDE2438724.1 hypothetical protein [Patescibacteria group bacterium]
MYLLSDVLTYMRRYLKTPSTATVPDALLIDYVNRFWTSDVDARMQLYDFKTTYRFETTPGVTDYNMPVYPVQNASGTYPISYYPMYQGFIGQCTVNGIAAPVFTQKSDYWNLWPNYLQGVNPIGTASGTAYSFNIPYYPMLVGHVDMRGAIAYNNVYPVSDVFVDPPVYNSDSGGSIEAVPYTSVYPRIFITMTKSDNSILTIADSGQFLNGNYNYGCLMEWNRNGNKSFSTYSTTSNTINYQTGAINFDISQVNGGYSLLAGSNINSQSYYIESGIPRNILIYDNTITLTPPPDIPYVIELQAYLTPAALLNTAYSIPFSYMSEYIALGAARKMMYETGDMEQLAFYEKFFLEQERLVWVRSQRQWTSTRTETIFSSTQSTGAINSIGTGSL